MKLDRWDRLAGRFVMAPPAGARLSGAERRALGEGRVRHVILFARHLRDADGAAALIAECRALLPGRPLVSVDHEGGVVSFASRVASAAPSPMLLGSIGDARHVAAWAESQATALREIGFNMVNAPVLDVASPSGSSVIGTRSYGDDPALAARLGEAAMLGYVRGGVVPVIKHFPGHGGVPGDSHVGLPVDRRPLDSLRRRDLLPFQRCIDAGAPVVMAAHVSFPRLSGRGGLPASASPLVLGDLLRGELDFRGVVMSDAFDMKGFGGAALAVPGLRAGIDLFCCGSSIAAGGRFAAELARGLREGRVDRAAAARRAAAVDALPALCGRRRARVPAPPPREAEGFRWRGAGDFVPPRGSWHLLLPRSLTGRVKTPLRLSAVRRGRSVSWVRRRITVYPADPGADVVERLARKTRPFDTVVIGLLGRGGLPEGQVRLARALRRGRAEVIAVGLLDPQPVLRAGFRGALMTFDFRPETVAALVDLLAGVRGGG